MLESAGSSAACRTKMITIHRPIEAEVDDEILIRNYLSCRERFTFLF